MSLIDDFNSPWKCRFPPRLGNSSITLANQSQLFQVVYVQFPRNKQVSYDETNGNRRFISDKTDSTKSSYLNSFEPLILHQCSQCYKRYTSPCLVCKVHTKRLDSFHLRLVVRPLQSRRCDNNRSNLSSHMELPDSVHRNDQNIINCRLFGVDAQNLVLACASSDRMSTSASLDKLLKSNISQQYQCLEMISSNLTGSLLRVAWFKNSKFGEVARGVELLVRANQSRRPDADRANAFLQYLRKDCLVEWVNQSRLSLDLANVDSFTCQQSLHLSSKFDGDFTCWPGGLLPANQYSFYHTKDDESDVVEMFDDDDDNSSLLLLNQLSIENIKRELREYDLSLDKDQSILNELLRLEE